MALPRLLAFSGSTRNGSYNQAVLDVAVRAARDEGADVTAISLKDYPMPLFSADLEAESGIPESVKELKARFLEADGLILASPEYNSAFSPLLKNTIDWCSRAESDVEPPLAAYSGKTALLLAASPGALGGLRGLYALRTLLQNIGITVYAEMLAVRSVYELVDESGALSDPKWIAKIEGLASDYASFAEKLS
ncbi:MAG: NAD(P)H-dependent oxidoreductase [Verrucomicrobiota bacterium]